MVRYKYIVVSWPPYIYIDKNSNTLEAGFIVKQGHVQQDTTTGLLPGWLLWPITMAACNVAMVVCWDWWSTSTRYRVDHKAMEHRVAQKFTLHMFEWYICNQYDLTFSHFPYKDCL